MKESKDVRLSVILAIRNEEKFIRRCLDSLLNQNFLNHYEIIVVDGMSTDRTRYIVESYTQKFPLMVRLMFNKDSIQSSGRNVGINAALGDYVLIFSGHAAADRDFVSTVVKELDAAPDFVAGVGGIHVPPEDENFIGKLIGYVQMSFLGGAGTSYTGNDKKSYVDSIAFVAYKKKILINVGLYDPKLIIGEDFELNWRIKKAGFKLIVCPAAVVFYYRRHSSVWKFMSKMFSYGMWRAIVTKKHPSSFKVIFLFPILLLLALTTIPLVVTDLRPIGTAAIILVVGYFVMIGISSILLSIKMQSLKYLAAIGIYAVEHTCIGLGFIVGALKRSRGN